MKPATILAVIADLQIGGTTALAPPKYVVNVLDPKKAQVMQHNRLQAWLWSCWTDYWDYVKELAGLRGRHRKHRIGVVCVGEALEGLHHGSVELIGKKSDQRQVAIDVLQPIADMADFFYGVEPTEVHGGPDNEDEATLYKCIGATDFANNLMLRIDGKLHDFCYHGRVGGRSWTSAAAGIATETIIDCVESGIAVPDFVWSAHHHRIDDSGDTRPTTRAISVPSWQLRTQHGKKVTGHRVRSDIGGYIVNNGILDSSKCRYKAQPDGRRVVEP